MNFSIAPLRHTLGMAVFALHKVNVVRALGRFECSIHFFNVQATIRETGMARRAGGACQLAVVKVACKAAQAFVHADRSAVVTRSNLLGRARRVALVAKRLPRISADLNQAFGVFHFGQAQAADRN